MPVVNAPPPLRDLQQELRDKEAADRRSKRFADLISQLKEKRAEETRIRQEDRASGQRRKSLEEELAARQKSDQKLFDKEGDLLLEALNPPKEPSALDTTLIDPTTPRVSPNLAKILAKSRNPKLLLENISLIKSGAAGLKVLVNSTTLAKISDENDPNAIWVFKDWRAKQLYATNTQTATDQLATLEADRVRNENFENTLRTQASRARVTEESQKRIAEFRQELEAKSSKAGVDAFKKIEGKSIPDALDILGKMPAKDLPGKARTEALALLRAATAAKQFEPVLYLPSSNRIVRAEAKDPKTGKIYKADADAQGGVVISRNIAEQVVGNRAAKFAEENRIVWVDKNNPTIVFAGLLKPGEKPSGDQYVKSTARALKYRQDAVIYQKKIERAGDLHNSSVAQKHASNAQRKNFEDERRRRHALDVQTWFLVGKDDKGETTYDEVFNKTRNEMSKEHPDQRFLNENQYRNEQSLNTTLVRAEREGESFDKGRIGRTLAERKSELFAMATAPGGFDKMSEDDRVSLLQFVYPGGATRQQKRNFLRQYGQIAKNHSQAGVPLSTQGLIFIAETAEAMDGVSAYDAQAVVYRKTLEERMLKNVGDETALNVAQNDWFRIMLSQWPNNPELFTGGLTTQFNPSVLKLGANESFDMFKREVIDIDVAQMLDTETKNTDFKQIAREYQVFAVLQKGQKAKIADVLIIPGSAGSIGKALRQKNLINRLESDIRSGKGKWGFFPDWDVPSKKKKEMLDLIVKRVTDNLR